MTKRWEARADGYGLVVPVDPWSQMENECPSSATLETGGILIGSYDEGNRVAVVVEATKPPRDSRRGPTWFHRGVVGLRTLLQGRWHCEPRRHYLGEWHYHPCIHLEPSVTDLEQMAAIANDPAYRCPEPILIVLGQADGGQRRVRAFVFPRGTAHLEFELVASVGQADQVLSIDAR